MNITQTLIVGLYASIKLYFCKLWLGTSTIKKVSWFSINPSVHQKSFKAIEFPVTKNKICQFRWVDSKFIFLKSGKKHLVLRMSFGRSEETRGGASKFRLWNWRPNLASRYSIRMKSEWKAIQGNRGWWEKYPIWKLQGT